MIYLGIDPGLDGALAAITADGLCLDIIDTPTLGIASARGHKREYELGVMRQALMGWQAHTASSRGTGGIVAFLEHVHAMPGQGVRSMFSMGFGCGVWEGLLAGLGIPYERVAPQRWKRALMDGQGRDKDAARAVAMRLFPDRVGELARKRDDGRAEALLIAEYGRRVRGRMPQEDAR